MISLFIKSFFLLFIVNGLCVGWFTFFKKRYTVLKYKQLYVILIIINIFLLTYISRNYKYINNFKNVSPNHVTKILINNSLYYGNQENFVEELKRGNYYFQSHRVQNIRKEWKVKIITQENDFDVLIEDTYKYGYTIYLIRGIDEVTYYKNNNIGKFLK